MSGFPRQGRGQERTKKFVRYVAGRLGPWRTKPELLRNFFARPLVATSFAEFWRCWNPFVGYWIGLYCYRPLRRVLSRRAAVTLTFAFSGFVIHDLATSVVKGRLAILSTLWFILLGLGVLVGEACGMNMSRLPGSARACIHIVYVLVCLVAAKELRAWILGG